MTSQIYALNGLSDREAIADALYRAAYAVDLNDENMLKSALTQDVILRFDAANIEIKGLYKFIETSFKNVGPLVTGHLMGNFRIQFNQGATTALMSACSINQHIRPKDQESQQVPNQYMVGSYQDLELRKEGDLWKISVWKVKTLWKSGDHAITRENNPLFNVKQD